MSGHFSPKRTPRVADHVPTGGGREMGAAAPAAAGSDPPSGVHRIAFNERTVLGIKATDARVTHWFVSFPGFGVRVAPSGRKTFVLFYRTAGGAKRLVSLGTYPSTTLINARKRAKEMVHQVGVGGDPASERRARRRAGTFGELADEYLVRHAKRRKRSWKTDAGILTKDLMPRWRNRRANEITRREVIELLDAIVDRGAPIQANRTLALARKIWNFGIERGLVESNPCHLVKPPGDERQRQRVLTSAELRILWRALDEDSGPVADVQKLRLLTAQRGREVMSMRWDDIDLDAAWWTVPGGRTKNKLAHRVPLSQQTLQILKRIRAAPSAGDSEWVFPSPSTPGQHVRFTQSANRRIRAATGLADFYPHDLRRTAASTMASLGVPRLVLAKLLNHVERDVTAVYDRHSYDAEKRSAMELWGACLEAILVVDQERPGPVAAEG